MPLSRNLGTLTSWNPQGHSRPVTGLIYLTYGWMFLFNFVNYAFLLCIFCVLCFIVCRSMYCLCVNVYCTAVTGCQPNCSSQITSYIISLYSFIWLVFITGTDSVYSAVQTECLHISVSSSVHARSGPVCSRKLRFPDYMTTAEDGGKVVSLTHRPPLPPRKYSWYSFLLRDWVDPRAIVRSEGFYVNEKIQCHNLGSNQRPSDL